jgi:Protein of unknown function (DUF3012)
VLRSARMMSAVVLVCVVAGCAPKVGSDAWCKKMVDTPKSEWSSSDASTFAKNCIFKNYE